MRDDDPIAPSLEDFERMAEAAFAALPVPFRARCENVLIRVEDFADDATLDSFEMESPFELTGLYHGLDLTQKSHLDLPGAWGRFRHRGECHRGNSRCTATKIVRGRRQECRR